MVKPDSKEPPRRSMRHWIAPFSLSFLLLFTSPELGPNPERAALTLDLGGSKNDSDDVTLATKDEKSLASDPPTVDPKDATTDIRSSPRTSNDKLDGNIVTRASPRRGNSTVTVDLCVDSASTWQAGTYSGTVIIDGPHLQAFAYP